MRVLVVSNLFPPAALGGYERRCGEVVRGLRRRGCRVHVLTGRFGSGASRPPPAIAASRRIAVTRALHIAYGPPYAPESLARFLRCAAGDLRLLDRLLAQFRPDVIDVWGLDGVAQPLLARVLACGAPVHLTIEDVWLRESWRHDALGLVSQAASEAGVSIPSTLEPLLGRGLEPPSVASAAATFVSEALAAQYAGVAAGAVRLAGLDLGAFATASPVRRAPPPFEIVAVGQLTASRGFEDLLTACTRALPAVRPLVERRTQPAALPPQQRGPLLRVRIVGGGAASYAARLAARAAELRTPEIDVVLEGELPAAGVRAALQSAHLFVHPSRLPEGLPRIVAEALAAGLPVVASDSGGQRELLAGGPWGRLFRAGDVAELAAALTAAIRERLESPARVAATCEAAQVHVRRAFDLRGYVAGHLADLRAAASACAAPRAIAAGAAPRPGVHAAIAALVAALRAKLATDEAPLVAASPDTAFRRALLLKRLGLLPSAARAFRALLTTAPRNTPAEALAATRRATFHLGEIALARGRCADAAGWLRRCLAVAPDHRKAAYDLEAAIADHIPSHLRDLAAAGATGRVGDPAKQPPVCRPVPQ